VSKKFLITGTSTGFGRLIAESRIGKGHTVVASMRGIDGKNAIEAVGGLDVVVNNAGVGVFGLQEDFTRATGSGCSR
jgi:NAD(P)-dependent dehydrogenase (short-subunit alcohol dehydrogenase family)